jgi:Short C-terminal domain
MVTRKKKSSKFFDKLKDTVTDAKATGEALSKVALEKGKEGLAAGTELGKKASKRGVESIEKGITSAKKTLTSSDEIITLIERLGKLKDAGLITEKEFQAKKKELLDKI